MGFKIKKPKINMKKALGNAGRFGAAMMTGGLSEVAIKQKNDEKRRLGEIDANLKSQTAVDEQGKPIAPEYASLRDPATGLLKKELTISDKFKDIKTNTQGLDQYRSEALRDPAMQSKWAQGMLEKNALEEARSIDNQAASSNADMRSAMDGIAAQGGMEGGAKFMMARQTMRDALNARQDVRSQSALNRMNTLTQDETNRQDMLGRLPGMELDQGRFDMQNQENSLSARKYDIGNATADHNAGETRKWGTYEENMKGYAAKQQSTAQLAGAKAQCFVAGTKVTMADGTHRNIEDIKRGEHTFGGGRVTMTLNFSSDDGWDLYDYDGVMVTGEHKVREDGEFIEVRKSSLAKPAGRKALEVYNLNTEQHLLIMNGVIFADYTEQDQELEACVGV